MFAPPFCPNPSCRHHASTDGGPESFYRCKGVFRRSGDKVVRRFQCKACRRHFSEQTFRSDFRQKNTAINARLARLREAGVSVRAAARLVGVNRKTAASRYRDLAAAPFAGLLRAAEADVLSASGAPDGDADRASHVHG